MSQFQDRPRPAPEFALTLAREIYDLTSGSCQLNSEKSKMNAGQKQFSSTALTSKSNFLSVVAAFGCVLSLFTSTGRSQTYTFSSISGKAGLRGTADGTNNTAHFYQPRALAVNASGNVFLSDDTTVRRVIQSGTNWIVNTIAGTARTSGDADGTNSAALFKTPCGIAIDAATNIYVVDRGNNTIRKITPVGTNWVVTTLAGMSGVAGSADGAGLNAQFNAPFGLLLDNAGNLFVADSGNNTIRKMWKDGTNWNVTTIAGSSSQSGSADGSNAVARFNEPRDVAADNMGNLYVTDRGNGTVRKITPTGTNWLVTTIAGFPGAMITVDGTNAEARFSAPDGIAIESSGALYVTDTTDDVIRLITPIGADWVVTTIGGKVGGGGGVDGMGTNALFSYPDNIKIDSAGRLYIADRDNYLVRQGNIVPFGIKAEVTPGAGVVLSWPSDASYFFQVWATGDLNNGIWARLGSPLRGNGSTLTFTNSPASVAVFFKVQRL